MNTRISSVRRSRRIWRSSLRVDGERASSCRLAFSDDVEEHVLERRLDRRDAVDRDAARLSAARRAPSADASPARAARRAPPCRTGWSSRPPASRRARASPRRAAAPAPRRSAGPRRPASPRRSCRAPRAGRRGSARRGGSAPPRRGSASSRGRSTPGCDSASMSRQNWRRDSGSTPPVGSSRKRIGGSWRIAQPSASRWRQPPARSRVSVVLAAGEAGHLEHEPPALARAARPSRP